VVFGNFAAALFGHFVEVEQLCFQMLVCVNSGSFLHLNSFFLKSRYASMARRINSATGAPVFDSGAIEYKGAFRLLGDERVSWDGAEGGNCSQLRIA
jgi:hypothetical protein